MKTFIEIAKSSVYLENGFGGKMGKNGRKQYVYVLLWALETGIDIPTR